MAFAPDADGERVGIADNARRVERVGDLPTTHAGLDDHDNLFRVKARPVELLRDVDPARDNGDQREDAHPGQGNDEAQ